MLRLISKYKLEIGGGVIGAVAGWCYWLFVGCASGSCLITSRPLNSTLYGAVMGALALSLFRNTKLDSKL